MNKERRNRLEEVELTIHEAIDQIQEIIDDEQDALDNMPDSLRSSARAEDMEGAIFDMEGLMAGLHSWLDDHSKIVKSLTPKKQQNE